MAHRLSALSLRRDHHHHYAGGCRLSLFNGDIRDDTGPLCRLVENPPPKNRAKLQAVEDTMYAIENETESRRLYGRKDKRGAGAGCAGASDYAEQTDFVSKLAGCFLRRIRTDEQLISAVNSAFGTELKKPEDFEVMTAIRAKAINTSGSPRSDTRTPTTVEWAKASICKEGGAVYGNLR